MTTGSRYWGLAALLMLCWECAAAGPRLAVSEPPLHALLAALTEGAAAPDLIYETESQVNQPLDPFQRAKLIAADLIFWVGPGLEPELGRTLQGRPVLALKAWALSDDVPLLRRDAVTDPGEGRQDACDLRFWNDPRLAALAVRQITPRLVHLDPEHQDLYLENELGLLGRLRALEDQISAQLAPGATLAAETLASLDPYFHHRFLESRVPLGRGEGDAGTIATGTRPDSCIAQGLDPNDSEPGSESDAYFRDIGRIARRIGVCVSVDNSSQAAAEPARLVSHAGH